MIQLFNGLIHNLGYIFIMAFVFSRITKINKLFLEAKNPFLRKAVLIIIFSSFSIIGTYLGTNVNGAIANSRIIGILAGGILFGPTVGIPSAIIASAHRLFYDLDGITTLSCSIATILTGIIASIIFYYSKGKVDWKYGLIGSIVSMTIEMALILIISKPFFLAINIVKEIYLPMTLINGVGTSILIVIMQNSIEEQKNIRMTEIENLSQKAEIKALQLQINPHFLFNSLNAVSSFVRTDPNRARELIINLSSYLRYNLESKNEFVTIAKELEQSKAYIEIEKARFGDKINIEWRINCDDSILIPSLSIQPLVENSIKHGLLKSGEKGTVKVIISQEDKYTYVSIIDDGIGISNETISQIYTNTISPNHIGLSNVHKRLIYYYGIGLEISNLNHGTKVSFRIINNRRNTNELYNN